MGQTEKIQLSDRRIKGARLLSSEKEFINTARARLERALTHWIRNRSTGMNTWVFNTDTG